MRIGGNTACVEVRTTDRQVIILDAGSGIRGLGKLLSEDSHRITGNILLSHTHWDHIQGFPYFGPAFLRNNRFVIIGPKRSGEHLKEVLARQIIEPYLPFPWKSLSADFHVKEVSHGQAMVIGDETLVSMADLNHPGGSLGFRIENNGAVLAYCTDTTHGDDGLEPNIIGIARNADLLIHDAHFTVEERRELGDWGHSSWLEAAQAAEAAKVKCLALFHFNPDASDDFLENVILKQAREVFPNTILAREGATIELPIIQAKMGDLTEK